MHIDKAIVRQLCSWYHNGHTSVVSYSQGLLGLLIRIKAAIVDCWVPRSAKIKELHKSLVADNKITRVKIDEFKLRIKALDRFVLKHDDLKNIVLRRLGEDQAGGVFLSNELPAQVEYSVQDTEIEAWGKLNKELTLLEYEWEKRIFFIELHSSVRECLMRHLLSAQSSKQGRTQARILTPLLQKD